MRSIDVLDASSAEEMAALHGAAFPRNEAWSSNAFIDHLTLPTTHARGIRTPEGLISFILVQFVADEAEILTIATASDFRRKGLARQMIEALQYDLTDMGLQIWKLDVAEDNLGASSFYRRLGFKRDGRRQNYYKRLEGHRVDAILMSKSVGGQMPN